MISASFLFKICRTLLTSPVYGSSCSKLLKSTKVNSVIKWKKKRSYLFKLLFILMRLSNSSLWEEKECLPSVKVRDRFSLKQLFLSFWSSTNIPPSSSMKNMSIFQSSPQTELSPRNLSQSTKWIESPTFLEGLLCFRFLYLLYGTYFALLCNVLGWPKSLLDFK